MTHCFTYRAGLLHAEDVDLRVIANEIGTPAYCYSKAMLEHNYRTFDAVFADVSHMICYAMKANSNQAVLKILARQGAGMDIVSGGELRRALAVGVPGERIIFSGVGKTAEEISDALDADISCFNIESEPELIVLSEIAQSKGVTARIAMRVNPDVDARTHAKISTGMFDNKFGIPVSRVRQVYKFAASLPNILVTGIDMHIGSQITELESFEKAATILADLAHTLMADGHRLHHLDFGGGLGISYREDGERAPHPQAYADVIKQRVVGLGLKLILEPGRVIAGDAGILLTRVIYVKQGEKKVFVIVDAAMNDLIRPALYDAYHDIKPVHAPSKDTPWILADVVGPICESGDFLALDRHMQVFHSGDLIAVMTAGAYGAVKSGTYNSRLLIPEVMVHGDKFTLVRPRESYNSMIARDHLPDWLLD